MTCPLCGERCTCAPGDITRLEGRAGTFLPDVLEAGFADGRASGEAGPFPSHDRNANPVHQNVAESPRPKFVVSQNEVALPGGAAPEVESSRGTLDPAAASPVVEQLAAEQESGAEFLDPHDGSDPAVSSPVADSWRDEVSARLNRYRARRRPRAPRYPSLRLRFETPDSWAPVGSPAASTPPPSSASSPVTCQALAMNELEEETPPVPLAKEEVREIDEPSRLVAPSAKILEFPRSAYVVPESMHELADPVIDRPRILEAPEVVTPPPAMGGITIEDARPVEPERRPGIDMPLRSARFRVRACAALLDGIVVLFACSVFGGIVYKMTGTRPPLWELVGLSAGLPCVFWAAYQYLFFVYCGTTPGLRATHLRISRFDGSVVEQRVRRMRVLCSFLSGISLGMGYGWQFLDEDSLCWHERVTRTYLAPPA